jgi:hypothetical protein
MSFKSYPKSAGFASVPAHQMPIVSVDADWVAVHGSRSQRRRIECELKRLAAKSRRAPDGRK